MDSKAIADAIAARFTGVTVSVGGVTEGIAVGPTASLPNSIGRGPALLVYPPSGVLEIGVSKLRSDELDYMVRLLRDPLNVPARSDALHAWYTALRDRVEMQMSLGLAYVSWARATSARVAIDGEEYADGIYDVVELGIRVHFNEIVTTVQP